VAKGSTEERDSIERRWRGPIPMEGAQTRQELSEAGVRLPLRSGISESYYQSIDPLWSHLERNGETLSIPEEGKIDDSHIPRMAQISTC
jgi:hypothetical protein